MQRDKSYIRRVYKKYPLLALQFIQQDRLPDYTADRLEYDVQSSIKPRPKRKPKKNVLKRYGRYQEMRQAIGQWQATGKVKYLHKAQKLRERLTKPYVIRWTIHGEHIDYQFDPSVDIKLIKKLCQIKADSIKELDDKIVDFRKKHYV